MLLLARFYREGVPQGPLLILEGLLVAGLGTTFARWLFPAETSLLAVVLAALATDESMDRLLEWNRHRILDRREPPVRANGALALRFLAMFLGMLVAWSSFGLLLDASQVEVLFSHQVQQFGSLRFADLDLGTPGTLLPHNLQVLLFFLVISMVFRGGGVMLAVAWNASVWGASFGVLARTWSASGGPPLPLAWLRVMGACFPHLLLEACAYVLAGMAGVFLGKGLLKHMGDPDRLLSILRTVGTVLSLALALVAAGALWEGWITPELVRLLSR